MKDEKLFSDITCTLAVIVMSQGTAAVKATDDSTRRRALERMCVGADAIKAFLSQERHEDFERNMAETNKHLASSSMASSDAQQSLNDLYTVSAAEPLPKKKKPYFNAAKSARKRAKPARGKRA